MSKVSIPAEREKEIAQKQVELDAAIDSWETDGGNTTESSKINELKRKGNATTGKEHQKPGRILSNYWRFHWQPA